MKVTRPGSVTPSMGGGDGRYPSSPYASFAYGKDAGRRRAPVHDHQVDIDTDDIPDSADDAPYHTPDIANVLGIPDNQVTPAVEQAIGRLMIRINGLTENLSDLRKLQAHIARNESRDPFTGATSRPAFLQILENEIPLVGRDRTRRVLLMCELANIDDILQRCEQGCKEGLFTYVRRIMADFIMPPHHLGYLGCNDFAALMYNVDEEDIWQRVDAITNWLELHPHIHHGQPIPVVPIFGLYRLKNGDTATSALNAADASLRARKEMYLAQLGRIPQGI